MATPSAEEDPRHSAFLDLCLLYGDFHRPVFLQAILRWFVESAGRDELDSLRRAIRDRTKLLRRGGRKGRPREENDWNWLRSSAQLVWQREVLGWSWPKIAAAAGMKPTKPNLRTLQNRRDRYAMLLWRATPGRCDDPKKLARILEAKSIQRLYRSRAALPFDTHPEECKKIVLKLAPRGLRVAAGELKRLVFLHGKLKE
jgi:hypothetical protein